MLRFKKMVNYLPGHPTFPIEYFWSLDLFFEQKGHPTVKTGDLWWFCYIQWLVNGRTPTHAVHVSTWEVKIVHQPNESWELHASWPTIP